MLKRMIFIIVLILAACTNAQPDPNQNNDSSETSTETEVAAVPTETVEPIATISETEAPKPLPANVMAEADICRDCHSNLTDEDGESLSFYKLWRPGMMANSARDPYWLATVSSEASLLPDLTLAIEDKCSSCHMPMASFDAQLNGTPTGMMDDGFLNPENDLHGLAMDGISCNLCHQIEPDPPGDKTNFSGEYAISESLEWGERKAFGPFMISPAGSELMSTTGFVPIQSEHISESEFCGTCHTLYTDFFDADGNVLGKFPEQVAYQEWENSSFDDMSCQECHMPIVEGPLLISSIAGSEKDYLREHSFVGANAFMISIFKESEEDFGDDVGNVDFEGALVETLNLLQEESGDISIGEVSVVDGMLDATVQITSKVGHKFPSGYPSRRVWIHFSVKDSNGEVVFESGAVDVNGFISGNDNDAEPSLYEPHYEVISESEQVQIYEVILKNSDGEVTTTLLRAAGFLKDNRLLPEGFVMDGVDADIAPYGLVLEDSDFAGGRDEVKYSIDLSGFAGPFTIEVELLYQSISFRWAENLSGYDTELTNAFEDYYSSVDNLAVVVSTDDITVGE